MNCKHATVVGRKVTGCQGCGSHNPEFCKDPAKFAPLYSKEQLYEEFGRMLKDRDIMLREYRDLVAFFWILGEYDYTRPNQASPCPSGDAGPKEKAGIPPDGTKNDG